MRKLTAEQLVQEMIKAGLNSDTHFQGCSSNEIEDIESEFGSKLPKTYKDFLAAFGKTTGALFNDVTFFYPDIVKYRDMVPSSFGTFELTDDHFVFLMRDDLYLFFDIKNGDDPPVYRFIEDEDEKPNRVIDSFSAWLNRYILGDIEEIKKVRLSDYVTVNLESGAYLFKYPGFSPVRIKSCDHQKLGEFLKEAGFASLDSVKDGEAVRFYPSNATYDIFRKYSDQDSV